MKYEYQLNRLEIWLKENRQLRLSLHDNHSTEEYKGKLERLENELLAVSIDQVEQWIKGKNKKEKRLIPYLYNDKLEEYTKSILLRFIDNQIEKDRRLFRVIVDVLYHTSDTNNLWHLVQKSHRLNVDRINRRMDQSQARKWGSFTGSNTPIKFLANEAYESEIGFIEELKSFYLTENLPLFKFVLLDVLTIADEDFYIREKDIYKKFFLESSNNEQQQMAEALIQKCKLNHVKPLGKLIYDQLKTYRRKPMLWKSVGEEEKKRFAKWILTLELKEFFSQVNKSHERFQYWQKFIVKLEDAVVIDGKKTLILYFEDVVIMEVLGTGAVYIYEINVFNRHFQAKIDKLLVDRENHQKNLMKEPDLKRDQIRNQDLIYKDGRLIHYIGWQENFDFWLERYLGWEVDANVLQKEAERDEGDFDSY
jgi:hypothetical protein